MNSHFPKKSVGMVLTPGGTPPLAMAKKKNGRFVIAYFTPC